jgi:two-component system chemotaxis sensor kinase CheA
MTLAGELVLTRNQLVQAVNSRNSQGVDNVSQRLDLVTSELQEAIMSTRMQPVGNVFNKFKRVVRDLTRDLGKKINLIIEGEDVDLDKTIIEAIGDPLTHLVRNSIDHGIEMPENRLTKGKNDTGTLRLSAFHEGGQVIIEIFDDGAGINTDRLKDKSLKMGTHDAAELEAMSKKELAKLIFTPGLSTAEALSDISGRGVGMDVVFTNLSKLGGVIDVTTETDLGTTITIKLPLTLAIIPSLIIQTQGERYAIPQVNLVELVRVPAGQIKNRIEKVGSALVMRLRGELLPLIHLADALNIETRTFIDSKTGESCEDQRQSIVDRRSIGSKDLQEDKEESREKKGSDRRKNPDSAYNILVLSSGDHNYGLIVDRLLDSEEIVVKPLGTHLRRCNVYSGATIQGDGAVALILDVVGLSSSMNLSTVSDSVKANSNLLTDDKDNLSDSQSLLIVQNGKDEQMAIPLTLISRIERIQSTDIAITGGRKNIHYRNTSLPLFGVEEVANVSYRDESKELCYVVVFTICDREVGILMSEIIDIIETNALIDDTTHKQPGIIGSLIIEEQITLLLDLYGIVATIMPEWAIPTQETPIDEDQGGRRNILIVEDSLFFLNQIKIFMEEAGYIAYTAEDGLLALDVLANEEIDLIITDIEMPNMDGLELTREIRKKPQYANLPIIAVTSVAGEAAEEAGRLAGINNYLIKLDREKIITHVNDYLQA